jgi:hypothetical protein
MSEIDTALTADEQAILALYRDSEAPLRLIDAMRAINPPPASTDGRYGPARIYQRRLSELGYAAEHLLACVPELLHVVDAARDWAGAAYEITDAGRAALGAGDSDAGDPT